MSVRCHGLPVPSRTRLFLISTSYSACPEVQKDVKNTSEHSSRNSILNIVQEFVRLKIKMYNKLTEFKSYHRQMSEDAIC